jgi:hypothetical protein
MLKKRGLLIALIGLLALLVSGTAFTAVAFGTSSLANAKINSAVTYPLGTVCGDALAGPYTLAKYVGHTNYDGLFTTVVINNMVLSGGKSGTVTSTSGHAKMVGIMGGIKQEITSATFKNLVGNYHINLSKGYMSVTFTVQTLDITFPVQVRLSNPALPTISIPCSTTDVS